MTFCDRFAISRNCCGGNWLLIGMQNNWTRQLPDSTTDGSIPGFWFGFEPTCCDLNYNTKEFFYGKGSKVFKTPMSLSESSTEIRHDVYGADGDIHQIDVVDQLGYFYMAGTKEVGQYAIKRAPIDGSGAATELLNFPVDNWDYIQGLCVDYVNNLIFFIANGNRDGPPNNQGLWVMPIGGGPATEIAEAGIQGNIAIPASGWSDGGQDPLPLLMKNYNSGVLYYYRHHRFDPSPGLYQIELTTPRTAPVKVHFPKAFSYSHQDDRIYYYRLSGDPAPPTNPFSNKHIASRKPDWTDYRYEFEASYTWYAIHRMVLGEGYEHFGDVHTAT